ncbi:MAG: ACT domain-containing protein [Nanoarchaeota archaeon]
MAGIKYLDKLIRGMTPELVKGEFVFCTVSESQMRSLQINPLLVFREKEGTTVILEKEIADENALEYAGVWSLITLTVHSDLAAIGFLAKITAALAEAKISVNAVSAYYHDHLFVPVEKAVQAMEVLKKLS